MFCQIYGIQVFAFAEYGAVGRVQIFWLAVVQHSSAKSDNIPPKIHNRKDYPIAKEVKDSSVFL